MNRPRLSCVTPYENFCACFLARVVFVLVPFWPRDFLMTKLVQLKRYALTPVVDLINHRSGVESDVSFNYFYGYFAATTKVCGLCCCFVLYGARGGRVVGPGDGGFYFRADKLFHLVVCKRLNSGQTLPFFNWRFRGDGYLCRTSDCTVGV